LWCVWVVVVRGWVCVPKLSAPISATALVVCFILGSWLEYGGENLDEVGWRGRVVVCGLCGWRYWCVFRIGQRGVGA